MIASSVAERRALAVGWGGAGAALALADDPVAVGPADLGRLWGAGIAAAAGWSVVARDVGDLVVERAGRRVRLRPVVVPERGAGLTGAQAIERALAPIFAGRAWALVLRRPVPATLDPSRVAEPARQWLARYDQHQWDGDYAIYEDSDLSLELRLLPYAVRPEAPAATALRVVRPPSQHALDDAERAWIAALTVPADAPVLPILLRPTAWHLGRRSRFERLYGKPLEAHVDERGTSTVVVRRAPGTWFGGLAADVPAIWWLAPSADDPLRPRGWAEENPWSTAVAPPFFGQRLAATAVGDLADASAPASLTLLRDPRRIRP